MTFEVKSYNDPLQPLMKTDLMKVNDVDITAPTLRTDNEEEKKSQTMDDDNTIFGMVVGFSLPPSSYATIALRELMKRPTSSEYQSKLELSGKCERNVLSS